MITFVKNLDNMNLKKSDEEQVSVGNDRGGNNFIIEGPVCPFFYVHEFSKFCQEKYKELIDVFDILEQEKKQENKNKSNQNDVVKQKEKSTEEQDANYVIIDKKLKLDPIDSIFNPQNNYKTDVYKVLYLLKLDQNKYYVGITPDFTKRFEKHKNGEGSYWTKKYKVIEILSFKNVPEKYASSEETILTCEMMLIHGINNIRGAQFSQMHEFSKTSKIELKQLIFTIAHVLDKDKDVVN